MLLFSISASLLNSIQFQRFLNALLIRLPVLMSAESLAKLLPDVLLPILFLVSYLEKTKKKINWEKIFIFSVLFSVFTVVIASQRTTFQPWYLVFSFSLASFVSRKYYIFIPALILSFFAILIYVAYVYMTDYAKNYPLVIFNIELAGVFMAAALTFLYFLKTRLLGKH